jgi:hypothetical protein
MADAKISQLVSLTGANAASDDVIPIVDTSTSSTKKITRQEFFSSVDRITFDTVNVDTEPTEGELTWDTTDKTLSLGLNGGDVVLQIGQELHFRVRNNTGSPIPDGTVCRFAGSVGNSGILLAAPFLADGTYDSHVIMGVATETIANGEDGLVTWFGKVRGINTSAFSDGAVLYASPSSAGGLTATKPDSPNNVVSVAAVVTAANNGTLFVRPIIEDHWSGVPSTASSTGRKGAVAFDANYFYVCVATNTWKRVLLETW